MRIASVTRMDTTVRLRTLRVTGLPAPMRGLFLRRMLGGDRMVLSISVTEDADTQAGCVVVDIRVRDQELDRLRSKIADTFIGIAVQQLT